MALKQFWFEQAFPRSFGVLRTPDDERDQRGIVFFPGLGETKAGPAFLFTRIAQRLATILPVLQFDYPCWGDSEGDMEESSLSEMLNAAEQAVQTLHRYTHCQQFVCIGSGVGNWIATKIAQRYTYSALILLSPYHSPFPLQLPQEYERSDMIDTGKSDQWGRGGSMRTLFQKLGADHYKTKGIIVRRQLLEALAAIDATTWAREYSGPVLQFHACNEQAPGLFEHQQSIALPFEDSFFTNPRNCDFIVEKSCLWIQEGCKCE